MIGSFREARWGKSDIFVRLESLTCTSDYNVRLVCLTILSD